MKGPEAADAVFEKSGDFLVMHKKGQDLPAKSSATQQKALSAAVADAGDKAIVIAFAPTEGARAQLTAELAEKGADMPAPAADAAAVHSNPQMKSPGTMAGAFFICVLSRDQSRATTVRWNQKR